MILIMFVTGCATAPGKETAIACQVADGATTIYAKRIGATEENPLIPNNAVLVAFKAAIIALFWNMWDDLDDFGKWAVTVISCVPVAINIDVIRQQREINRRQ